MQIFIGVNKNRKVSLHTVEPVRCMDTGKWVSSRPYVNSVVQKNIDTMISHSKMTWEMEPEVIEIDLKQIIRVFLKYSIPIIVLIKKRS